MTKFTNVGQMERAWRAPRAHLFFLETTRFAANKPFAGEQIKSSYVLGLFTFWWLVWTISYYVPFVFSVPVDKGPCSSSRARSVSIHSCTMYRALSRVGSVGSGRPCGARTS